MRASWILIGMVLGLLSCDGSGSGAGHVEISGKTPAEGAALAASAICTHEARCGSPGIACMGGGSAGGSGSDAGGFTSTCEGTIRPVAYDDCFADASADIARLLSCPALTPEQINMLEICVDILAARRCVTQAEVDAQARVIEGGGQPMGEAPPAACAVINSLPPGC